MSKQSSLNDEYEQDVRRLIVLDTQFTFNGETDLKLHEIRALETRGWVSESAENGEYDVTEEGKRIIDSALKAVALPENLK